ncbi:MAG TPA: DUF4148 domain-containing protein [Noviherbaspirillum sp.]|nr:DUF4148 domain-containing protein [Noviherbaspirillum sp.]
MNAKHFAATFAMLAAGSVYAQEYVAPDENFVSTRTRAEVIAEIDQARADGTLHVSDTEYPVVMQSGMPKTRAEVVAEIERARADGTLYTNDATYPVLPVAAETKSRDEVRAELEQYRKLHPYGAGSNLYSGS